MTKTAMIGWSCKVALLTIAIGLCFGASSRAVAQKGVDVKPFLNDDGSGGLYVSSPLNLDSDPWSWETCSPDLTSCAPYATGEEIKTGRAAPETVFRISGDGRVGISPLWHGNLSVAALPSVTGLVRANELVTPVPASWNGGWDGDLDLTQLAACATATGERCISLTDAKYIYPCPHEAAVLDRAFTGKYLRVASRRFGLGEGSTLEGHSSPFGDEVWSPDGRTAVTVVGRIEPATGARTVRCGPPPLIAASISGDGVAKVGCAIKCLAVLMAEKEGSRVRLGRRLGRSLFWSRERAKLRLSPRAVERLGPGPARMTVEINGEKITERMVRLKAEAPPEVRLVRGSVGGNAYEIRAHRESRHGRSTRPCLSMSLAGIRGRTGDSRATSCGPLTSFGLMFGLSTGEGKGRRTMWAIAHEPMVRRVRFELTGHRHVVVPLTLLSRHKSRKAGLRRFSYGVLALRGQFCLTGTTTYDAQGRVIRDADEMIC